MGDCSYCNYQPVNTKTKINPFILGLARLFDFPQILNQVGPKNVNQVDTEAIKDDWDKTGEDLWIAIDQFKEEHDQQKK